jgi:hypothetical protein
MKRKKRKRKRKISCEPVARVCSLARRRDRFAALVPRSQQTRSDGPKTESARPATWRSAEVGGEPASSLSTRLSQVAVLVRSHSQVRYFLMYLKRTQFMTCQRRQACDSASALDGRERDARASDIQRARADFTSRVPTRARNDDVLCNVKTRTSSHDYKQQHTHMKI